MWADAWVWQACATAGTHQARLAARLRTSTCAEPLLNPPSLEPTLQPSTLADFRTPGADLKGVHYLRNVEDADSLIAAIADCKAAGGKVSRGAEGGRGLPALQQLVPDMPVSHPDAICSPCSLAVASGSGNRRRLHRPGVCGRPGAQRPGRHNGGLLDPGLAGFRKQYV